LDNQRNGTAKGEKNPGGSAPSHVVVGEIHYALSLAVKRRGVNEKKNKNKRLAPKKICPGNPSEKRWGGTRPN